MKVLFVCLGNICRSPTAESVFRAKAQESGFDIEFDSAGTSHYHCGESSDMRSMEHAKARGYAMTHFARQVIAADFANFDYIFAMDLKNMAHLQMHCPDDHKHKLKMLTDLCSMKHPGFVPDPYYGNGYDFDYVIDLCEDAWDGFRTLINK